MSDLEFRPVTEDEWPAFLRTTCMGFASSSTPEEEVPEKRAWPLERSVAAVQDGQIVGTAGAYDFELTLPGLTTTPAAGVTWVSVRPDARRQGALRGMMRHQLDDVHERGVPVAILLASESVIYGRFGYGLATTQVDLELDRQRAVLAVPFEAPGRVRVVTDEDEVRRLLPAIHDRVRRTQPGDISRPEGWWNAFFGGRKPSSGFYACYESPGGEVEGYAYYRVSSEFVKPLSTDWTVVLQNLGALTFDAYVALWRFVWDLDLAATVVAHVRPPDEPLRHLLADPRRLRTTRSIDYLWCRIVDVGDALAARRYEVEGAVVLEVRDEFCPWNDGRWRLDGSPEGATCARTDESADLTLSANELGAAFLGGTRLSALAAARRVDEHATRAVARTDSMLATARAPWCRSNF